jgi:hypothetical protein
MASARDTHRFVSRPTGHAAANVQAARRSVGTPLSPVNQLMWIPEIAREITRRWISEVPSKMV